MRINHMNKVNSIYKVGAPKKTGKVKTPHTGKDNFAISDLAKDYQTAKKAVGKALDIREDKVDDIKQRLKSGTYHVDAKEVADKIVDRHFEASI